MALVRCVILFVGLTTSWAQECEGGDPSECSATLEGEVHAGLLMQKRRAVETLGTGFTEEANSESEEAAPPSDRGTGMPTPTGWSCNDPIVQLPWATAGQNVDALGLAQGGPGEPGQGRGEIPVEPFAYGGEPLGSGAEVLEERWPVPAVKKQTKKEEQGLKDPLKHHPRREPRRASLRSGSLVEIHRTHQTPPGSEAKFSAVTPTAGSTAGGTTVTIWGQNLYMPHARMDAGGGTSPSSLQPSVRVFMGTIECVVESFQSRPEAVKCVTPALEDDHMQFTDVALAVSVMKLQANGTYAPAALDSASATTTPTFQFSSAATPELVSVFPQVSGPGDVLRIHAWSCSGVVEAEPMELVRLGSTDNATSQGSDRDGAVNSLVDDPAEAWGAICEPFPPHGVRNELQLASQLEADQAFSNVEGGPESVGARGLYGVFFKDPDEDSLSASITTPEGMDEFLENNHVARAYRYFIAPSPVLQYNQWWEDTRASFVVLLEGWLLIEHPGTYRFKVACEDRCLVQVGDRRLVDRSASDRRTAGWNWWNDIETDSFQFPKGWQRIKIVHVNILNPGGSSGMRIEYTGPPTDGWEVIPQRYLRAGITQATVDGLNRDADRQRVGRSPQSLVPAKKVQNGDASGPQCPGATARMKVEFFCKVPQDMQPGFYNLKFHDYHYGQSVESAASQWDVGMGARKASVRIVPKVTKVEEQANGGLLVTGFGLDELPLVASGGTAHYGDVEYRAVNGTQDFIELVPSGPLSNGSAPGGGTTRTLGSRGLLREYWFRNKWPSELQGLGETPSISRSAELITPVEDANGAGAGFSERISGLLVPPMTGECRFRIQGTRRSSRDTENDARLYLSDQPLSVLSSRGEITSRPRPALFWPGASFTGAAVDPVDLAHLGYEGFFGGAWSLAAKITFGTSTAGASGTIFEFGHPNGNRIKASFSSTGSLTFTVCRGTSCSSTSCDDKMDPGNQHEWIFSASALNVLTISRDGSRMVRNVHGRPVESQSRPYLHLWIGRGIDSTTAFSGTIEDVKIFNVAVHWGDAYGPEARSPPPAASTTPMAPYFALKAELSGQPVQPVDLADSGLGALGGAMSFAFTARWDGPLTEGSRVLDFANGADDAIVVKLGSGGSLSFCITSRCLQAAGAVEAGQEKKYLVVVNSYGELFIYCDQVLLAESSWSGGVLPATLDRFHLWVGRANSAEPHLHSGLVKNFTIFKGAARWQDAFGPGVLSPPPLAPLPPATPVLVYAGRNYSGDSADFDDASAEYDAVTGGGFSMAFTARVDASVAGAELLALGSPESQLTVSLDTSGALQLQVSAPSSRRRRRNPSPLSSTLDAVAPTIGEENRYLCAVTARGQVAIYKDGALERDSLTGVAPHIQEAPLYFGKGGFRGLLKNVKLYSGFVRWSQAFPVAPSNATSFLQVGPWQRSWTALDQMETSTSLRVAQMIGSVSSVEFDYGNPVVQTDWDNERASSWMLLRQGEEYPFKLERKLGGKTADTGATGWKQLGFECRSLEGHPELLPRRSEIVSMSFKGFPVRVTLPASPSGYQLSFRGRQASVSNDEEVGKSLLSVLAPSCSVQPPVDNTAVKMLANWEELGSKNPSPDAYCGLGAMRPNIRANGEWTLEREQLSAQTYKLQDLPFLSMCFKLESGAAVNMLVNCKVGTRNREQWFSVGMTLPNFDEFHGDYKRAAQWPIDANTSQWQCASIDLMSQIMSYDSYERRFRDVNYNNFDASHLANMEIKGIYLGTPVRSGNTWKKLRGQIAVDQLIISTSQVSVVQSQGPVLGASLPFSQVRGASTGAGWLVRWFRGYDSYRNLQPTQQPEGHMYSPDVNFNLGYNGPPGLPGMRDTFVMIASARITFEAGRYQWAMWVDDEATVFIDGTQVAHQRCCVSWGATRRWSSLVDVTAGVHEVEVHFKEVGGVGHISAVWRKEGSSDFTSTIPPPAGVGDSHSIDFIPTTRAEQGSLQALLQEVTISGGTGLNVDVSLPDGSPNETITARLLPPPGVWTPAYFVTGTGLDLSVAMNRSEFNAMFAKCPVVRYLRNGRTHSVYVRTSQVPTDFDAYSIFLEQWRRADNTMGQDFEIYSTEEDARAGQGAWTYCNYDYSAVGYPRDCGKTWWSSNIWFAMPSHGGPPGVTTGAGFEIYDGQDCFSASAVGAGAQVGVREVSFPMNSDATTVVQTLAAAGFPALDYRVLSQGDVRWLDLHSQPATMSSVSSGRAASLAIDGHFSQSSDYCATSESVSNPWLTVQLGGTFSVDSVRLLARTSDGGNYLSDVTISVDGKVCARNVHVGHGGFAQVRCHGGYGSSLTVARQASGNLVLCELEVAVLNSGPSSGGAKASGYTAMVSSSVPGDPGVRVSLTSPMASEVKTVLQSSGTRYWGQVTDYWFRMPHQTKQVTFGSWRDYICGTELSSGCAPVAPPAASPMPGGPSLLHLAGRRHPSLLARPPHTLDGGHRAATLGRRHPQRRWRTPQRFHTPESLETLRRAVLGTSKRPKGWAEASALLQKHAGRQGHFASRHGGGEGADPRADPNALPWSSPSSWGGEQPPNFDTTDIVYIPEGKTALLDMDVYIRFWVIEGNLVWSQAVDLHMEAEAVVVNGGEFLIGSETDPYTMNGQITLHGNWHSFKLPLFGSKGIFEPRGNIEFHGKPKATTWTELESTAHPGDSTITLRTAVDWKAGDLLVIAASDQVVKDCRIDRRDYCQVEERYVQDVTGNVVTLDRPLAYRHVAEELDPVFSKEICAEDASICAKTQMRSEVGLLTRNIKLKGSNFMDGSEPGGSEGYGAHIMMAERGKFSYIEFHWMGQAFQMGRYPIHYHLTGLNPTSYLKGCSLHTTFQRGVTIHGTHQATVKDNVLYNHLAHGFFIEDGNEHDNIFENNLGMMGHVSLSMLNSDQTPATFWIRNPSNYFRHNHAAGCASFGFWFDTLDEAALTLQREFFNNTAHSNGDTGVWVDIVDPREGCVSPDGWSIDVPFRNTDEVSQPVHSNAPACEDLPRVNFEFKSTTTWGNGENGITLVETGHLHVINHRSVSEPIGTKVWGVQSDNWPDETNNWYGPVVRNSAYHSKSQLTSAGWNVDCSIKTPWDDTLFISGAQFIGPVSMGHICPCAECMIVGEGGYQIRTSKLEWHDTAGTPRSPKVFWEWQFLSFFFDFDGTLTEDVPECQQYGCYLHSGFQDGGMYSPRSDVSSTSLLAATAGTSAGARSGLQSQSSCMNPQVGRGNATVIPDAQITFSTVWRNDPGHKTVRLDGRLWAPSTHDQNQWVQFEFGAPKFVSAIQTKGRPDHDQWVKSYRVSYTMDGQIWKHVEQVLPGNRDRNTMMENRVTPFLATMVRIEPKTWRSGIAMRAEVLGCDAGTNNFTSMCFDRAYLDDSYRNCRAIERSYNNDLMTMQAEFCQRKGHLAKHTMLTANQACCACGGGSIRYNVFNETVTPPDMAPVLSMKGGTGHLDPEKCRVVDSTGGIVCSRATRMQTVTVKDAGIWHTMNPIDVQTDFGWAQAIWNPCYRQYEFTVLQDMRHALMPPITPTKMHDWDRMSGHITMRAGDRFVIQIETIHNPDGFTVNMPGIQKTAACDQAPVKYGPDFFNNQTLLDAVSSETSGLSAARQGLSLAMDMYKVAHMPLLDSAWQENSAANWAYLKANTSTNIKEWFPGMFSFLLSDRGVVAGANHYGPWNGLQRDPMEKLVTRPLATAGGADFGFSHIHTTFSWSRWDRADPSQPDSGAGPDAGSMTRLEYLVRICGMNPTAFKHLGPGVEAALATHSATSASSPNPIAVGNILRFSWSAWPAEAGAKPTGPDANVTIQPHWEVTLDENVTNLNLLDVSGVLKFADQPGCCTLAARYIIVGAFFGRLEAGTASAPIAQGKAHIILRGQPLTPPLATLAPHIRGSAAWMKSKFLAVQGTLSLYGKPRASIWAKISSTAAVGDTSILLEGGDFQVGDGITIDNGMETRILTAVASEGTKTRVSFASPLQKSYLGANYVHLGKQETAGLMASYVGLVKGHTVVVEGEDTPGPPMCSVNETHTCPYATGFPRGANLADFAKQLAGDALPNCRPCGACSEMDFSGYVIAMAHFHQLYDSCPKDHGSVQAVNVEFAHGSSMHLYHDYAAGNYPYDVPRNFPGAWGKRPHTWWEDPIWAELQQANLLTPSHTIRQSAFNNALCGTGLALATSGVYTVLTESVEGNVFLTGGVGLNAAAHTIKTMVAMITDQAGPYDDNLGTVTLGVGSPSDDANPAKYEKSPLEVSEHKWSFVENFLSGAPFASLRESDILRNVFLGPVRLQGTEMEGGQLPLFQDNTISSPGTAYCVSMRTKGTKGIANNVIHSCRACLGFRSAMGISEGVVRNMKLLSCSLGIDYRAAGPDARKHDARQIAFKVEDTTFYAKADGSGTGLIQPTVHSAPMGEPAAPEWWNSGPLQDPIGESSISLFFHSELRRCQFVGFDHSKGAVAIRYGGGYSVDADYHPMMVAATSFVDMDPAAYVQFATSSAAGPDIGQCLQIDCDGRRNSLLVDVDGSLLGQPGTVVPRPMKFYDKLAYADPMGAATMEDLIPMPQRYDTAGAAIPFPSGVDHGTGGGLEYECKSSSTQADRTTPGCDVLFMAAEGQWAPKAGIPAFAPGARVVAIRQDGDMVRLDPLHHGLAYAGAYVRTPDCRQTMDFDSAVKPESQHARRYGRAAAGSFGAHPNTTRNAASKGPVYTVPGIFRAGCTEMPAWNAFSCPGAQHRHLLIEVMDWNFRDRRVAPVTVEVNDQWAPQGGALNVLTGPAMRAPEKRTQTFHALGHLGMRHNIYFSADPPSHIRLHLQYAPPETGVVVCIFYGVPNTVYAYVNGVKKQPLAGATPGWDNAVLTKLTPDMPHGTHFYDRIGVETGKPGYLYAVVRGGQSVDFKISHKVQLTTKVTVSASWGGWNNASGDSFFNKGIDGLVRNIALLIGAPPNRVKILGEGSAVKGTFWNEDTTSKEFAEYMWKQNESLAYSDTDSWLSSSSGGASSSTAASLLQLPHHRDRSAALLQTVDASRRHLLAAALSRSGKAWLGSLRRLTVEERRAVLELRAHQQMADGGDTELEKPLKAAQASADRTRLGTPCNNTQGQNCDLPVTLAVDDEDYTPASAHDVQADGMKDAVAIAEDENKRSEIQIEDAADTMFLSVSGAGGGNVSNGTSALQLSTSNGSFPVLNAKVDDVPHMTAPLGWQCSADWYEDGSTCHCDCGIWDPDCDSSTIMVPAISMAEELQLLDRTQVTVLMNLVDADGDANGVLNGNEIVELDRRLGQSALLGLAQRIIQAQEKGANKKSLLTRAMRLGDFAMLAATETSECAHRLDAGAPVGAELAAFRPMCVRDSEFDTVVGQATGHCSLLPEMKVGSQCMVPGNPGVVGARRSHNNDTSSNDSYVPSPEAVCGILGRIFRAGQGVGGHRSAGVGMSSAKWTHPGGEFLPGTDHAVLDMNVLGFQRLDSSFRGGLSFYATVRVDRWQDNVPLFHFGMPRGNHWDSFRQKHINVYTKKGATEKLGLEFHMGYDSSDWRRTYRADNLLNVGEEAGLLFTVSPEGKVQLYKKGVLVVEQDFRTNRMVMGPFDNMWIAGGYDGKCPWRYCRDYNGYEGLVSDIRIWDSVVTWNVAVAGVPPGSQPQETGEEASGDLPAACTASRRNTWDFICDDSVPQELAADFGYATTVDPRAQENFDRRQVQGEVTICAQSINVKSSIFHGKFGDGLTGEYFGVRRDCNPPFLFGQVPKLVRVDPVIDFQDNLGFSSSFNQYAVRWTGKILIESAGTYTFKLNSKDGSWLAVGGRLVVTNSGCHDPQDREGSATLDKGGLSIAVLFFNKGPDGGPTGTIRLSYKGPDTQEQWSQVPQAKLASAPLRLSRLEGSSNDTSNETQALKMGAFVYHEDTRLGVMPAGACDIPCRRGTRKEAAAPFKFFCSQPTTVSFVANVNREAQRALAWVDSSPVTSWDLSPAGSSLLQQRQTGDEGVHAALLQERGLSFANGTSSLNHNVMLSMSMGLAAGAPETFVIMPSGASPDFYVGAGEHTLLFQGSAGDDEAFAFGGLRLEKGMDTCVFFLEGTEKLPDDC